MLACEILKKELLDNGGLLFHSTRAEQLEKDNTGRVTAFIAKGKDGKYRRYKGNKAVILATGDIGGNREMLEAFCPIGLKPRKNLYFPEGLNTGDGHKMAYWIGAAFDDPAWASSLQICGHSFFFLHVNQQGKRFMNEDTWMQAKAVRCLMQPGGDYAFTIMDSKWFKELGERFNLIGNQGILPMYLPKSSEWNPDCGLDMNIEKYIESGLGAKSDTLDKLAEMIGVPAITLFKTVARYNDLVEMGDDVDFGKRKELLTGIVKPPFYALKWYPALQSVFGGVLINTNLNVISPDLKPIDGLYAVGNASGGLYGVDYPPILGGSGYGRALTWALAVADGIQADSSRQTNDKGGKGR